MELDLQNKKGRKENIPTSINEDEITINLNGQKQGAGIEEEKGKNGLFSKFRKNEEENNPEVIEANIYKNTAKANEAQAQSQ